MKSHRKIRFLILAAALGLALMSGAVARQQTAGELFEKALYVEEGQGDLQKAIGLYQDIVKKFPGEREIAAKALLHIGICYEKLGKTEARGAYNRLLRDYADQLQLAKEARSRLAQLEAAGGAPAGSRGGLTFRKLDIPDAGHSHQARLSPDGSKFLYVGFQDREPQYSLKILDLASGKSRTLVEGIDANRAPLIFAWAPDGKKAVYRAGQGELRVVDIGSGESELFWASPIKGTSARPLDWSDQNHSLLICLTNSAEDMARLAILPRSGGTPRTVISGSTDDLSYVNGQFSPDGTLIVGDMRKDKNVDIYVWKVDTGEEIRITDHQAEDAFPFWSPDGKYIVFMSDRAKTYDLWAIPMDGPRPAGEPIRLQANIGRDKVPSGLTRSGVLTFYAMSSAGTPSDLFVLTVDPETGKAAGKFRPFATYPTKGGQWSPDGSRIAYTSRKGNFQLPNAYITAGGDTAELEIPARNNWMNDIAWSRDGKSLIFPGWNNDDALVGIFRISLDDQEIGPIHKPGQRYGSNFGGAYLNLRWLPLAGRYIFFRLIGNPRDGREEIFLMDPRDYKIEQVAEKGGMGGYSFPSPDGRYLIALNFQGKTIDLAPMTEGNSKVLMTIPAGGIPLISWAPDGKSFVYSEENRLMIYSVPGGQGRDGIPGSEGLGRSPR
jgi:Tol biopolymer transport system component